MTRRFYFSMMRTILALSLLAAVSWSGPFQALCAQDQRTVLTVDLQAPTTPVSPILHGLMTEEINYSYDGGLYAELIRNRAFLDDAKNEPVHWSVAKGAGTDGDIRVVNTHPLSDKLPNSLEVEVKAATATSSARSGKAAAAAASR
jgi:alpha-N-arabinofuranosidase